MSDLISRSELLKSFEKSYCGHLGMENSDGMMTFRSICRIIKEQPAAYDIDKVVEELLRYAENQYKKAIDDLMEKASECFISDADWNYLVQEAEQLKAGGDDEQKRQNN